MNRYEFDPAYRRVAPCTLALMVVTTGVFLIQSILQQAGVDILTGSLGLSVGGMLQGHLWTLATYLFLHGGVFHLLVNMLMLYMLGSELERRVGIGHYLTLYFISGILGGLGWLMLTWPYEGVCVGASGAIFGLLGAFAMLYPNREMTVLVFFIIPVTLRAWVLAAVLGLLQLLMMISPAAGGIAYSAHLAGCLAGVVYILVLFRPPEFFSWWERRQLARSDVRRRRSTLREQARKDEVDRLLDKVAHQGLHSLTPTERKTLDRASAELRNG